MKYRQLNKSGKIQFFSVIGIAVVIDILSLLFKCWWVGVIATVLAVAVITFFSLAANKIINDMEKQKQKFIKNTKYKDIRYMTDEQYKKLNEKGYFITEDGIPVTKNDIEEI